MLYFLALQGLRDSLHNPNDRNIYCQYKYNYHIGAENGFCNKGLISC